MRIEGLFVLAPRDEPSADEALAVGRAAKGGGDPLGRGVGVDGAAAARGGGRRGGRRGGGRPGELGVRPLLKRVAEQALRRAVVEIAHVHVRYECDGARADAGPDERSARGVMVKRIASTAADGATTAPPPPPATPAARAAPAPALRRRRRRSTRRRRRRRCPPAPTPARPTRRPPPRASRTRGGRERTFGAVARAVLRGRARGAAVGARMPVEVERAAAEETSARRCGRCARRRRCGARRRPSPRASAWTSARSPRAASRRWTRC